MVELLANSDADIVTASPYHRDGAMRNFPVWKRALGSAVSRLNAWLLPGRLSCYTSMFRAYRREWFSTEFVHSSDFKSIARMLVGAVVAGAKVAEFPIVLKQRTRRRPPKRVARAVFDHLRLVVRILVRGDVRRRSTEPGYVTLHEETKRRPSV